MAEEIVACPGCAKKFRIPEGAPPGTFPCTACSATVPYGAQPAAAGKGAQRATATKAAAPTRATAAPSRAAAPATSARAASSQRVSSARAAPARGARRGHDEDVEPPKKSYAGYIWAGIVVGGGLLVFLVNNMTKAPAPAAPPPSTTATAKPTDPTKPAVAPDKKPVEQPKPAEQPKPTSPDSSGGTITEKPDAGKPVAPINPAPKAPDEPKKPAPPKGDFASLGQTFASVTGTSDDERAQLDKYVSLAMDQGSAREGAEAEGKIVKAGKKAIPSILTAFGKQSTSGKWATDSDQWSADKLQDLLHRITGADGLNSDFWPRFMSGAPPEDFQKAANMWINWWIARGQFKDKYKPRND